MQFDGLLNLAHSTGAERARALESNFAVGAALAFSNGKIRSGANYEDQGKTPIGSCAERATLVAANNEFGPLSDRGANGKVIWTAAALWANTPLPPMPCGICRDALAASTIPESIVISRGAGPDTISAKIEDLFPLAGRGKDLDVGEEIERWAARGGNISNVVSLDDEQLLNRARLEAPRSFIPPFSREPRAGAVIELSDGTHASGWFVTEATTRLGGSAITMAARKALIGSVDSPVFAVRVALFTDATTLRAPNGYDLQMLQELSRENVRIVFGCLGSKVFSTTLDDLYPSPFGRRDLGY